MPLSFVLIGGVSNIATMAVDSALTVEISIAMFLLLINLLILAFGLYLVLTRHVEPAWITVGSILTGCISVLLYGSCKYQWVQRQRKENKPIFPQLL